MLHAAAKRRPRHTRLGGIALPRVDGRTITARRYRGLVEALEADLGGDLSEPERGLIAQAAAIQIQLEQVQRAIVEGRDDVDNDTLVRLSSEHRRLMASLRSKGAKNKPTAPSLAQYLANRSKAAADEPEAGGDT